MTRSIKPCCINPRSISLSILGLCLFLQLPLRADTISFEADSVSSEMAKGKEKTTLVGNAKLKMDNADIKADRIEILGKDNQYAFCSGNVTLLDTKKGLLISTESLKYDRKKELSRMEGPTILEDKQNKVVIKGSFVESDGKSEITVIQIGVRILKDDMVCRSEYALYRRKEKTLELTGLPIVVKGGDEYRASRIDINIDNNEIKLDGSVKGSIKQAAASPSPSSSPTASPSTDSSPQPDASAAPGSTPNLDASTNPDSTPNIGDSPSPIATSSPGATPTPKASPSPSAGGRP